MSEGSIIEIESETVKGAFAVSGANAIRALDAPVRNPIIAEWDPVNFKVTINTFRSTFIVMLEHMLGALIMTLVMFSYKIPKFDGIIPNETGTITGFANQGGNSLTAKINATSRTGQRDDESSLTVSITDTTLPSEYNFCEGE